MSAEAITAERLAGKGLALMDKVLSALDAMTPKQLAGHTRHITDCVLACVKVQAEAREQLEFEREHSVGDLRRLLVEYLAALKPAEVTQLMAEAQKGQPAQEMRT